MPLSRRSRLVLFLSTLTLTACLAARHPAGPRSASAAFAPDVTVTETDVHRLLFALADDSMQGRMTGTEGSHRAARYIASQMAAIGLKPAGDSGGYLQHMPLRFGFGLIFGDRTPVLFPDWAAFDKVPADKRFTDANVVGVLEGADPVLRDSVVLVDAHYDHLGRARGGRDGDSVYNGADDDASGVVTVLSVARALAAGPRPRRSVVFLLTTGEEVGLLGTQWYMAHPVVPLARTVANLEVEMVGRPDSLAGGPGHAWLTGDQYSTMGEQFRAAGLAVVADPRPGQNFFERSDNIAFAVEASIPAHTLSTYNMHGDYHTVRDEASRADIPHMTAVARIAARAVRMLADGPPPAWRPIWWKARGRPAPVPPATR